MNESILNNIKKMLGFDPDYNTYDVDIIVLINSVLSILTQNGIGPKEGFALYDAGVLWSDFLPDDSHFDEVKAFVYMRVRLIFDPPASGAAEQMKQASDEILWRLNVKADEMKSEEAE